MRSPVSEYNQGVSHSGPWNLKNSPEHCKFQIDNSQQSLHLPEQDSPFFDTKNSPQQNNKSKEILNGREYSPILQDKLDTDQQDLDSSRGQYQRKESRIPEKIRKVSWYTPSFATYKARSEEFKRYFKDVPPTERLIVDYSCALQREILLQGRLYTTQNYLCFYANIFGWETCVTIKWREVWSLTKEKTALVIPNAILIGTDSEKLFFTTFAARDKSYLMLFRIWQNALLNQSLPMQTLWSWIHDAYGEELGLTSDDEEDYDYVPPGEVDDTVKQFDPLSTNLTPDGGLYNEGTLSEERDKSDRSDGEHLELLYSDDEPEELKDIETEGFPGTSMEKSVTEVASSTTDSINKDDAINIEPDAMSSSNNPNSEAGLTTDMSDNSSDSNAETNAESKITCTSPHDGRLIVNIILPINIDELFQLLFTNSKFLVEFHSLRRTTDFKATTWQIDPHTNDKMRTVSMVAALTQSFGPRSSNVHEIQALQPCSKNGQLYSIVGEVFNSGIPYSDSFYVVKHYCLEKLNEKKTQLMVFAQIKYKKNVWALMKNVIEKNTWSGLFDFYDALIKALQVECEETITPSRKGRRRQRSVTTKPTLLTVDQIPGFARGVVAAEGEKRNDWLLIIVLAVLVFLVFFNGILYYNLWALEDKLSKQELFHTDSDLIRKVPQSHKEWVKAPWDQENVRRTMSSSWRSLQVSVEHLHKAEETLTGLMDFLKSNLENSKFAEKGKEEL